MTIVRATASDNTVSVIVAAAIVACLLTLLAYPRTRNACGRALRRWAALLRHFDVKNQVVGGLIVALIVALVGLALKHLFG